MVNAEYMGTPSSSAAPARADRSRPLSIDNEVDPVDPGRAGPVGRSFVVGQGGRRRRCQTSNHARQDDAHFKRRRKEEASRGENVALRSQSGPVRSNVGKQIYWLSDRLDRHPGPGWQNGKGLLPTFWKRYGYYDPMDLYRYRQTHHGSIPIEKS